MMGGGIKGLCAALCALSQVLLASGEPELARYGFEEPGNSGWTFRSPNWSVVDGAGRDGGRALVWDAREPAPKGDIAGSPRVPVEPGRICTFACWVKSDGISKPGPIYFNVVTFDAKGKSISSVESRPLIRDPVGRKGWERIVSATERLPGNAAFVSFSIYAPERTKGRVCFDDFVMTVGGQERVHQIYTSAYRDLAVSGKVRFVAPYIAEVGRFRQADLSGEFEYTGADGRTAKAKADYLDDASFGVTLDMERFAIGTNPVRAILKHRRAGTIGTKEIAFTRAEKWPRRKAWFGPFKRLILGDKPFFPIGMYAGRLTKEELDVYREGAFNCLLCAARKEDLDLAESYGYKAIASTAGYLETNALANALAELKDHPAVIAWYTNDEMPPGYVPRQTALQETYRRADPDHPTFTVLDKPWQTRAFMPTFDVIGMDPYPIGNHRGGIDIAYGWAKESSDGTFGLKPIWQVPQCFNWKWCRDAGAVNPEYRFPTREEFRSMAWQPIAAGANGLVWWSFGTMRRGFRNDPEGWKANWAHVKDTVAEVAKYAPMMLSIRRAPAVTGATKDVPVRVWNHEGEIWLLAVNTMRAERTVKLSLDGIRTPRTVAEFGPEAKSAGSNSFALTLPPLGISMLKVR